MQRFTTGDKRLSPDSRCSSPPFRRRRRRRKLLIVVPRALMAPLHIVPSPFDTRVCVGTWIADLCATPIAALVLEELADDAECQTPPLLPFLCKIEHRLLGSAVDAEIVELCLPCDSDIDIVYASPRWLCNPCSIAGCISIGLGSIAGCISIVLSSIAG